MLRTFTRRCYANKSGLTPIYKAIEYAETFLNGNQHDTEHESKLLLSHVIKKEYNQIPTLSLLSRQAKKHDDAYYLNEQQCETLNSLLRRRKANEPLQYITGTTFFYGREFHVKDGDHKVLIPRDDSEVLVDAVKEIVNERKTHVRVLDIGTGSGCLITTLVLELSPLVQGVALDIDKHAIHMARKNFKKHNVNVELVEHDIMKDIQLESFDIVISNPPYIASRIVETLENQVRDFEPKHALDGGQDGLDFYKRLATLFHSELLKNGGVMVLEIGYDQGESVPQLFGSKETRIIKDLSNHDRVVVIKK